MPKAYRVKKKAKGKIKWKQKREVGGSKTAEGGGRTERKGSRAVTYLAVGSPWLWLLLTPLISWFKQTYSWTWTLSVGGLFSFAILLLQLLLEEVIHSSTLSQEVSDLVEMIWAEALGHLEHMLLTSVNQISLNDVSHVCPWNSL